MAARNRAFDAGVLKSREFDVPTICVGNITVGGTGKTPHIEYIARLLKTSYAIAVLSRGYGRKSKGYIKAVRETTMEQIGDEPFQIKEKFTDIDVAVCEKRTEGIDRLVTENKALQAVLLDDAFQHRHVKAGLNILLIDSNRPVWRDNVMPFGRLRESIGGISRADIVIFTKCKGVTAEQKSAYRSYIKEIKDIPVYFTTIRYGKPYPLFNSANTAMPQESRVLLVTGIANPQPLKAEIEERGAKVEFMQYGDHHNFSTADFDDIVKQFRNGGYTMIVTTEKDATRMKPHEETLRSIRDSIYVMPIEVEFLDGEEKLFNDNIYNYVTENSRDSRIP
jgi:tetraacyldisaccharide 4'-kinase